MTILHAELNISTSYSHGDMDDTLAFYSWLKTELSYRGFQFSPGNPTSWSSLKELALGRIDLDIFFPIATFKQRIDDGKEVQVSY